MASALVTHRLDVLSSRSIILLVGVDHFCRAHLDHSQRAPKVVKGHRIADYLEKERITWIVDCGQGPVPPSRYDRERLGREFAPLTTWECPDNGNCPSIGVWRRVAKRRQVE